MSTKKGRIDYFQRCDYTYAKVHSSQTRRMWNGLIVNKEDYDEKPKLYNLRPGRVVNIVPQDARPDRPLQEYSNYTDQDLINAYKQYNP